MVLPGSDHGSYRSHYRKLYASGRRSRSSRGRDGNSDRATPVIGWRREAVGPSGILLGLRDRLPGRRWMPGGMVVRVAYGSVVAALLLGVALLATTLVSGGVEQRGLRLLRLRRGPGAEQLGAALSGHNDSAPASGQRRSAWLDGVRHDLWIQLLQTAIAAVPILVLVRWWGEHLSDLYLRVGKTGLVAARFRRGVRCVLPGHRRRHDPASLPGPHGIVARAVSRANACAARTVPVQRISRGVALPRALSQAVSEHLPGRRSPTCSSQRSSRSPTPASSTHRSRSSSCSWSPSHSA